MMNKESKETILNVEDFNGKLVRFKSYPSSYKGPRDLKDLIGITFVSDGDDDGMEYVHVVFNSREKSTIYFQRDRINNFEIIEESISKNLKEYALDRIKLYHTNEQYMNNLNYLEALANINKIKVIEK